MFIPPVQIATVVVVVEHGVVLGLALIQVPAACSCSCRCVRSELSICFVSCPALYLVVLVELFNFYGVAEEQAIILFCCVSSSLVNKKLSSPAWFLYLRVLSRIFLTCIMILSGVCLVIRGMNFC